ncbi:MAG: hypothetical protein WKF47_03890 [Geodermatophilaceae bacterium]|jgi:hypothetical protein
MRRLFSRLAPAAAVVVALTSCGAGQITQTASQVSTVGGSAADVGDIALRDITLEYPDGGTHEQGDDVRLEFVAVNTGALAADSLLSVSSSAFEGEAGNDSTLPIELPPGTDVSFTGDGEVVELTGLSEQLLPTMRVAVTFTFETAGEVTAMVPVAVPLEFVEDDVAPFDFHGEE